MRNILYKLTKPHSRLKINFVDVLLLIEPVVMNTQFYLLGRIFLVISLLLNYAGYYICEDMYTKQQRMIIRSTMFVIAFLLIYLVFTGA
ncbi:MAG: hypothetical protein ACI4SR_08540 [Faecalibacillus sp.]